MLLPVAAGRKENENPMTEQTEKPEDQATPPKPRTSGSETRERQ
jgi:hypothetical protein